MNNINNEQILKIINILKIIIKKSKIINNFKHKSLNSLKNNKRKFNFEVRLGVANLPSSAFALNLLLVLLTYVQ